MLDFFFYLFFVLMFGSDKELPRLGIPGGRWTAVRWVAGGLLAGGAAVLLMYGVILIRPQITNSLVIVVYIPVSLAVITAQRSTIAQQLSSTSVFYKLSCAWGFMAAFLQLLGWLVIGLSQLSNYTLGQMSYVLVATALIFCIFLGWPQSGELTRGWDDRAVWSVMTGVGAGTGALIWMTLINWLVPDLDHLVLRDDSKFWIAINLFEVAIWTGVASGQSILIFVREPVREPIESEAKSKDEDQESPGP
jgi:hypothetical protein